MEAKYSDLTPYNFVSNNPNLFIDPDGLDNVIYLVNLRGSGVDKPTLKAIADKANDNFKKMGLNTRVMIYNGETFNRMDMDKTDAFALMGKKSAITDEMTAQGRKVGSELEKDSKFGVQKDPFGNITGYGLEAAEHPTGNAYYGVVMGLEVDAITGAAEDLKSNFVELAAFVINHGAGHNSNLNHAGEDSYMNGNKFRLPYPSIMIDGNDAQRFIRGFFHNPQYTKMEDFISLEETNPKSPLDLRIENKVIRSFLYKRFGDHIATPSKALKNKVE